MTTPNDILRLSDEEKRARIQELEAELNLLYQSVTSPDCVLSIFEQQANLAENQTPIVEETGDVSINLTLFDSIPDMVYILNSDFDIIIANQALAYGMNLSVDEICGLNLLMLLPLFRESVFYQIFKDSMTDKQIRVAVAQFDSGEANPNDQHWYESRIYPVDNGILVIARDITRQHEIDEQIMKYQLADARMQLLDEMVQNLAHDFRTPLSILHTSLYLLEHYTDPAKQQKKLEGVKRQVTILEKMIENILLLTMLNEYRPSEMSRVDIIEIVESAVQTLQTQADAKKQKLSLHVPYQSIYHVVHIDHFIRALSNIIENAIFYTPDGGSIDVILEKDESHSFRIIVRDTGIGILEENLPHIFDRFYRVNQARTVNEAGNGLGLSISKEIIELHDGQISVISNPEFGTEVTLII